MNFTILKGQMYGNKLYKHQVMIKYMGKKAMQNLLYATTMSKYLKSYACREVRKYHCRTCNTWKI